MSARVPSKLDGSIIAAAATAELNLEPLDPSWILAGKPVTRSKVVARSRDWSSSVVVWDCTAGSFWWHYGQDEAIVVISGEAFMLRDDGTEQRLGEGDYAFFPAGSVANWRVDSYIRKVALLREPMWRPLGFALKVWNKLLRKMGFGVPTPLGNSSVPNT